MTTVLHIDSSVRSEGSVTRDLSQRIVDRLAPDQILRRDLATTLPLIDETWVGANFTPEEARDAVQTDTLSLSDSLLAELDAADVVVIGSPVYNFAISAGLKAWIDQITRVGKTFNYTPDGPVGLLKGKRVIIALASGGTTLGSDADFASTYLRFIFGFIGITDVTFIAADSMSVDPEASLAAANDAIAKIAA